MKRWEVLLTLAVVGGFVFIASARAVAVELCVDDDNTTGIEDGSPKYPYNTIREAINVASSGGKSTVRVAAGLYAENIRVNGRTVHLLGGYKGGSPADYGSGAGGTFSSQAPGAHVTHIRGDGTDAVVTLLDAGSSTLDGFRITGGTGHADQWSVKGGGVYLVGGSPTISRNTIKNNDARHPGLSQEGGGVASEDSDVRIMDNLIANNFAGRGAGIAAAGGEILIRGNTIRRNTAVSDHGGGAYISGALVTMTHNLVSENEVGRRLGYGWGGGVVVYGGETSAHLSHNRFSANYAPTAGGGVFIDDGAAATLDHELIFRNGCEETGGAGIYVDGAWDDIGSTATLTHCTVVYNTCAHCSLAGGLFVEYHSRATVSDSIFWGHGGDDFHADATSRITVTYTNSKEKKPGKGNLSAGPLFADPGNDDYHLKSRTGRWSPAAGGGTGGWVSDTKHSPCIDKGSPQSEFKKEPMPNGGRINMGAYGNTREASKASSSFSVPALLLLSGRWPSGMTGTAGRESLTLPAAP